MDPPGSPVATVRSQQALRRLNAYQDTCSSAPLVLVCRTGHYRLLAGAQAALYGAAHVEVLPVDAGAAVAYLESRTENRARWEPVTRRMTEEPDGVLARALNTPWHVNLAVTVHEERSGRTSGHVRDPAELLALPSVGAVREQLLSSYLPAVLGRRFPDMGPRQVRRCARRLGSLAALGSGSGPLTDFALSDLWRTAARRVRAAEVVLAAVFLLVTFVLPLRHLPVRLWVELPTLGGWVVYRAWRRRLPRPRDFQLLNLRNREARRQGLRRLLKVTLLPGGPLILVGLIAGVSWAYAADPAATAYQRGVRVGICPGAGIGLAGLYVLTLGTAVGATLPDRDATLHDPRRVIRRDVLGGAVFVLVLLAAHVLFMVLFRRFEGQLPAPGVLYPRPAVAFALYGWSDVSRRYAVFLLVSRFRFPFRLGAFLHRCQEAGILRTSGPAYQFRQQEYQEWLAAHRPPGPWRRLLTRAGVPDPSRR